MRSRGTSGAGLLVLATRRMFSGGSPVTRPRPRIISSVSSWPVVVISPTVAPLPSTTMFVATVDPCETSRVRCLKTSSGSWPASVAAEERLPKKPDWKSSSGELSALP